MKHLQTSIDIPVWTALITPLKSSGDPDLDSLERLIREQEKAGNGILILGSTGEALNLSDSERRTVLEFTTSRSLKVPVMAGVGGHQLSSLLSWIDYLENQKLDALLMVTPVYSKPGLKGQIGWFSALMDRVSRPVMLYNIPGRAGIALHPEAVRVLRTHSNFWAIKEASGSVDDFCGYASAVDGEGRLYSGDDIMLPDFARHGVSGVVSVAGNVWPEATALFCRMALEGALSDKDIRLWKKAGESLFYASNPVPVKALLYSESRISTPQVKLPLHSDDMVYLQEAKEISHKIHSWHKNKISERVSVGC